MREMIYGFLPFLPLLLGFLTVYIAFELHKRYPKQTVIQLSEQILGKFAGKLVSLCILSFYLISGTGHIIRGYSEFIVDSFLV